MKPTIPASSGDCGPAVRWAVQGGGNTLFFAYTADGERIWSHNLVTNRSAWRIRDLDGKVLRELVNQGGVWSWGKDYVYRDGQLLSTVSPTEGTRYVYADHLGTPRQIKDAFGGTVEGHHYYAFGEELTVSQTGEPMRFTGRERDYNVTTGTIDDLDYMHARHYSPHLGRFFSIDPLGGNPRRPQSWNRYAYVMGRPLVYTDPYGLQEAHFRDRIEVVCRQPDGGVCVPSQNHSNPQGDPLTGLAGLNSLNFASAFLSNLSSLGSDLAVLRPSDFSLGRTAQVSGMGLAAFTDGVIPFADPLENAGVYDSDELGLEHSQKIGQVTRDVEIILASTGSGTIFGQGKWINSGQHLRIGHSTQLLKGQSNRVYFSLRGQLITRVSRALGSTAKTPHWNLWVVRYFK